MVGRPEQDGLRLERNTFLPMLEDRPAHGVALLGLVQARSQDRPYLAVAALAGGSSRGAVG